MTGRSFSTLIVLGLAAVSSTTASAQSVYLCNEDGVPLDTLGMISHKVICSPNKASYAQRRENFGAQSCYSVKQSSTIPPMEPPT